MRKESRTLRAPENSKEGTTMEGTVYKSLSRSGRVSWRYQVEAGRNQNGKRIRISASGFRLGREAQEAMRAAMQELNGGSIGPLEH
jgi:hypothetical protein